MSDREDRMPGATDDETQPLENDEDQGDPELLAIDVRWPLNIVKNERSIYELHRQWQRGFLKLSPDYQREFVWKPYQQMRLVESVMARIPLPVFYLSEEPKDELLVIDGMQRLTTLFAFVEGWLPDPNCEGVIRRRADLGGRPFQLRYLPLMPELEGSTFATLGPRLQRRFEDTALTCFIVQKGTHDSVKYELFGRLNQGATPLTPQEMRNALNRGTGLEVVKELAAEGGLFREVAGPHCRYDRHRADELVLRGISCLWTDAERTSYRGDLQAFLNETLWLLNSASDAELQEVQCAFLHALEVVRAVFGEHSFQRFDPRREQWAGHVSGPLVEVQIAVLGTHFHDSLPSLEQAERLKARFRGLCQEVAFQDALLKSTQTRKNFDYRMKHFKEIVHSAAQPEP